MEARRTKPDHVLVDAGEGWERVSAHIVWRQKSIAVFELLDPARSTARVMEKGTRLVATFDMCGGGNVQYDVWNWGELDQDSEILRRLDPKSRTEIDGLLQGRTWSWPEHPDRAHPGAA